MTPYACVTEQEVRKITSNRTDLVELHMVEDGHAYYLIPGTLVRVTRDYPANGMSEILLGGITRPLWTYTKFVTARPIRGFRLKQPYITPPPRLSRTNRSYFLRTRS